MVPAGIKTKSLSSVNYITKTIRHHHQSIKMFKVTLVTEEYPLTWFDLLVSRLSKYFHLKKKIDPNVSLVNLKHFLHHYKGA